MAGAYETATRVVPRLFLAATLGLAACGAAVRDRLVPDLDCGSKPGKTLETKFGGMQPGDIVRIGHVHAEPILRSDATVSVTPEGVVTATGGNSQTNSPNIEPIPGQNGVVVTSRDETYRVTAQAENGAWAVTVNAACKPAQ